MMSKAQLLYTGAKSNLRDHVLGEVEKKQLYSRGPQRANALKTVPTWGR